jgi:hypothetical protein
MPLKQGGTFIMDSFGRLTPNSALEALLRDSDHNFRINYESDAEAIARHVSRLVRHIRYALTEKTPEFRN